MRKFGNRMRVGHPIALLLDMVQATPLMLSRHILKTIESNLAHVLGTIRFFAEAFCQQLESGAKNAAEQAP